MRDYQANEYSRRDAPLLQLSVLGLGSFQDGDIGVGILPEGEKILIGGAGLGGVTL